jgi:tRNA (cytidine/uridine-2'-O-)-methyltransferase
MFGIVLYQPEIPPNTGNIIRLCANTGAKLHLIHPLGFDWEDKRLRRAGLDYSEWADIVHHKSYANFKEDNDFSRVFALSTKGKASYHEANYQPGDGFIFGPETRGLPPEILDDMESGQILRIPMRENSRSLNLSNTAAIVVYEVWRQLGFTNAT